MSRVEDDIPEQADAWEMMDDMKTLGREQFNTIVRRSVEEFAKNFDALVLSQTQEN